MISQERIYQEVIAILGRGLDRRIIGDPDFSARIPAFSHFVIKIAVSHDTTLSIKTAIEEFNQWSCRISTANVEEEHPICHVTCHLRPLLVQAANEFTPQMVSDSCDIYELVPA